MPLLQSHFSLVKCLIFRLELVGYPCVLVSAKLCAPFICVPLFTPLSSLFTCTEVYMHIGLSKMQSACFSEYILYVHVSMHCMPVCLSIYLSIYLFLYHVGHRILQITTAHLAEITGCIVASSQLMKALRHHDFVRRDRARKVGLQDIGILIPHGHRWTNLPIYLIRTI